MEYCKARKVLLYMDTHGCYAANKLQTRACLLGRSSTYYTPGSLFLPDSALGSRSLAPYLDEIDANFAGELKTLVAALGVRPNPSIEDIRQVQTEIMQESQDSLSPEKIEIAIACLEIAVQLKHDVTDLLVPDTACKLKELKSIVHGDPLLVGDNAEFKDFNFTHPKVSADLATGLSIDDAIARAISLEIDIDENDTDFTPQESLQTVISDTLERYPIAATFNEFLANADDARATKLIWTLDQCNEENHASASLLTKDLHPFQGSALMVYNDGSK